MGVQREENANMQERQNSSLNVAKSNCKTLEKPLILPSPWFQKCRDGKEF